MSGSGSMEEDMDEDEEYSSEEGSEDQAINKRRRK